jgi:hypothetical protein
LIAADSSNSPSLSDSAILLHRADELIEQAERRKALAPHANGFARTT